MEENTLEVYVDGSSSMQHKTGGWAAVYKIGEQICWIRGYISNVTNSVAEVVAAIKAIEYLPICDKVTIFSDSLYVVHCADGVYKKKTHKDLWKHFDRITKNRVIEWRWVKGHNGDPYNTLADALASYASKQPDIPIEFGITKKVITPRGRMVYQPIRIFYRKKDKR